MNRSHTLEWIRAPQQARSQETLERLLDAAEVVLAERGVEGASVAEIAKRAGSSVGAFYARFHDKEALLGYLFQRFDEQADATAEAALDASRWEGIPLPVALESMLQFIMGVLHEKRGLIAAMLSRTPSTPALGLLGDRMLERVAERMRALLASRKVKLRHRAASRAVDTAVWMIFSALELRAAASLHKAPRLDDGLLAAELAEVCVRYLGIDEPTHPRATRARPRTRALPKPPSTARKNSRAKSHAPLTTEIP
jgi:AcrR family transcriptional regulator